jgi:flagellar motor switch/type III secretory pathway protein FliN
MNETTVIDASARPRETAREHGAAWVAARVLGSLPRRLDVAVGGFGTVALTWEGYGASAALRAESAAFALSRGREEGRVTLDAVLAARVVAVALGADAEVGASLGRLGPGARGIVAGFVAGVLHGAGAPLSIALAAPAPGGSPVADGIVVSLRVGLAGATGWAALEVPRGWLDDAGRLPFEPRELAALAVDASVELGRTTLTAGELSAVEPGDAVVFEGVPALAAEAAWPVRLVLGGYGAEATGGPHGALARAGGFGPAPSPGGGGARGGRGDTTALTSLPIELVAELARVRLRGDEVVALEPGSRLVVDALRAGPVVLRVTGEPWAEGTLSDVDGELAVRVTRLRR